MAKTCDYQAGWQVPVAILKEMHFLNQFLLRRRVRMALWGFIIFAAGLAPEPLPAEKTPEPPAVRLMEHRYRAAKTLQATFIEVYTENGRKVRAEAGVAYFRRPGKMRWEYAAPESNLFLIDGKMAWFYVPADNTVTRVPAKESRDWRTPLALLAGETKVSRVCVRIELAANEQPEQAGDAVFTCTLRGASAKKSNEPPASSAENSVAKGLEPDGSQQEDTVLLEINRQTGELARIVIRDKGGIGLEFHFKNWVDDPEIAEALFHFSPPPGVAIVNAELPAGQGNAE
ncbi:MAG TPA: outer membrane lipoprotein carrier protein LolA [Candidatus Acidoferrum sp.]